MQTSDTSVTPYDTELISIEILINCYLFYTIQSEIDLGVYLEIVSFILKFEWQT